MKSNRNHPYLFQIIAPIYGWFYGAQIRKFRKEIAFIEQTHLLDGVSSILDVGCGTGALACALGERGYLVTGVDPVAGMIRIARKKAKCQSVNYIIGNVLDGLSMEDNLYDAIVSSYVAHGLNKNNRIAMYKEMKRVARDNVFFFEYNQKRNLFVSLIEWAEGGDYFRYIKDVNEELAEHFHSVHVVPLSKYGSLYICDIHE